METALVRGIAAMLGTAAVGTWSTTTPYTAAQVGIYDGPIGSGTVEGIGLATYPVSDAVDSRSVVGIQLTFRSASKAALRDRAEAAFDLLHALWGVTLTTGLRVDHMLRQSSADLGIDENGAYLRTDNYYVTTNHPTPNRP